MAIEKSILHVDMDAFFASVEKNRRNLEGPIVVCVYSGRSEDSGAVSTCSYEARELGIHAAMPITRAKDIAENLDQEVHFVEMNREYYREVSDRIREEVLKNYADKIEQASIDEAYLELENNIDEATDIAKSIQQNIQKEFDLTCSIGIGPNKLVAKIASDREKPRGLTVVRKAEVGEFMMSLDLEEVHGIGARTVEKLEDIGINSVKELSEAEDSVLVREFGENLGLKLKNKAKGRDDSEIEEKRQKQITKITTLAENSNRKSYIVKYFPELTEEIFEKLVEKDLSFRKVSLIVIDSEIEMYTKTITLKSYIQQKEVIAEKGEELIGEFLEGFNGEIRRVGLRVKDLKDNKSQETLKDFN